MADHIFLKCSKFRPVILAEAPAGAQATRVLVERDAAPPERNRTDRAASI